MSSDSDYFVTTYSGDERIEASLKESREKARKLKENRERRREQLFKRYYDAEIGNVESLLNFPGLQFLKYTHRKIKFSFSPSAVAFVSERYKFYCSLWHRWVFWKVKRNTFPVDIRCNIYKLFWAKNGRGVTDREINGTIDAIYDILVRWARNESKFRSNIYERFLEGDDIILDSVEEEMFLNAEEIQEIRQRRNAILRRMIPPS